MSNTTQFQLFSNLWDLKTVSLKLTSKLNQNHLQKIIYSNNKLIWLDGSKVESCKVMDWRQLYVSISNTETLYLLYFIIMSKYVSSPYLETPSSFEGLEAPFSKTTIEEKQLLL